MYYNRLIKINAMHRFDNKCVNELNIHTGDVSISMDGRNSTTTATTTQSKLHLMRMLLHLHRMELNT